MFSPYQTSAEIFAQILSRHEEDSRQSLSDQMVSHRIVSIPNGQQYGENGHIPCKHYAEFLYMNGEFKHVVSDSNSSSLSWRSGPVQ